MSEDELRRAFGQITAEIRPVPDPYPRLMKRNDRQRRGRVAGWTAAAVAALIMGPVGLQQLAVHGPSGRPTSPADWRHWSRPITEWVQRLIDSPTRGALAVDQRFLDSLVAQVDTDQHAREHGARVKVLFAEDVGDTRLAIAALYTDAEQVGIFMSGPKG